MPLITPPALVSAHLAANGFDLNPNLLIIAENYPNKFGVNPWGYFYRTLFKYPIVGAKSFFDRICDNFGIPVGPEPTMLNDFLNGVGTGNGRRLIIDALQDGAPPVHPITATRLSNLVEDINYINPNYIMLIHNRNIDTVDALLSSATFNPFINRLVENPLRKRSKKYYKEKFIFPFPSGQAPPQYFTNALNAARAAGYPI